MGLPRRKLRAVTPAAAEAVLIVRGQGYRLFQDDDMSQLRCSTGESVEEGGGRGWVGRRPVGRGQHIAR